MFRNNIKLLVILFVITLCNLSLAATNSSKSLYSVLKDQDKLPFDGMLVELNDNVDVANVASTLNGKALISSTTNLNLIKSIQGLESRGVKDSALKKLNKLNRLILVGSMGESILKKMEVEDKAKFKKLVSHLEPNLILTTQYLPNDTFLNQSTIFTDGTRDAYSSFNLNLAGNGGAWDIIRGNPGVLIAVVDTGVDKTHPDLLGNIWTNIGEIPGNGIDDDGNGYVDDVSGWDFVNRDADNDDDNGHGTHVSGLVAARADNQIGIAGACPSCRVVGVKVLSGAGAGSIFTIVQGMLYAVSLRADVINMSLGAKGYSQALIDAVEFAFDLDTVVVVAAGNSSDSSIFYSPAGVRRAITVAAAGPNKINASFSNYGPGIDVAAPGGGTSPNLIPTLRDPIYNVISLLAANSYFPGDPRTAPWIINTQYIRLAGTSMASPNVAGVAGLIRSLYPNLNADQVAAAIKLGGSHISNFDLSQGHGNLDAVKAFQDNPISDVRITSPSLLSSKSDKTIRFGGYLKNLNGRSWTLSYRPLNDFSAPFVLISQNFPITPDGIFTYNWTFPANLIDGDYLLRLQAGESSDFGTFRKGPIYFTETDISQFTPGSAYTSAVYDVDSDGDRDIILGNIVDISAGLLSPAQNYIFIGDGRGNFVDKTAQLLPDLKGYTTSILTGDFNGDRFVDLFVVSFNLSGGVPHFILFNDGHGKFTRGGSVSYDGVMCGYDGDVGDVDKDGDLDVILGGSCYGGNILILNDGRGNFVDASASGGFIVGADTYYGGKLVDVDNDGDLDAIFNTTGAGGALLLINNGDRTFTNGTNQLSAHGMGQFQITVADINQDGYKDFYAGNGLLYINQGAQRPGWFTLNRISEKTSFGTDILFNYKFGDIDRDRDSDLIGFGGDFAPGTTIVGGRGKFSVGLSQVGQGGSWQFINKTAEYAPKERTFDTSDQIGLADADGDGDLDVMVYIQSIGEGFLQIYYNQILTTGDANMDGRLDILDALLVSRAASGIIRLTSEQIKRADVDYNNNISIIDAQWIARKAANPSIAFPAPPVQ